MIFVAYAAACNTDLVLVGQGRTGAEAVELCA